MLLIAILLVVAKAALAVEATLRSSDGTPFDVHILPEAATRANKVTISKPSGARNDEQDFNDLFEKRPRHGVVLQKSVQVLVGSHVRYATFFRKQNNMKLGKLTEAPKSEIMSTEELRTLLDPINQNRESLGY